MPISTSILRLVTVFLFISSPVQPQEQVDSLSGGLRVGITEAPPFVIKKGSDYTGLSMRSWELVQEELNLPYKIIAYPSLGDLLAAVETGEVDLSINPITVTDKRMQEMEFSQPYFIAHTAVLQQKDSEFLGYLGNLLSWNFLSWVLILVGVIFIFGTLVWLFERHGNNEQFEKGRRGIFQGFWWSAVTMTTVGYGDKAPRTFGGRVIGFIWMFVAIIVISTLTAGIASSLTVRNMQNQINSIEDLDRFGVVTVEKSSAQELLEQYRVPTAEVIDAQEGIEMVLQNEADLFVYDEPILNFYLDQMQLGEELEILQKTLKKDYYSYSFPKGSELVDIVNPVLVGTLKTMEWNQLVSDYK